MRKSLAILPAAALLALSACAGSGGDDTTAAAATSSASAEAKPAAAPAAGELTRDNFVERIGAAQAKAGSTHLQMSTDSNGRTLALDGDVQLGEDVEDARTRLTLDVGQMAMELRMVDGVAYLKLGALSEGKFVKVDLTDPNDPMTREYGSLTGQIDPAKQLKSFRSALVEFENQGDGGTVDGVETTRLRLVLDTAKVMKHQNRGTAGSKSSVPKQVEYTLLVGSDDLMRQMTMDFGDEPVTVDWTKWGEPVEVTAPAKSQITDSNPLAGLAGLGAARG
ncbi:hypothetical protein [Aeromicrobium duanguangcaii]|uniref:LppX_LprAFG lipoprotein n=1 Tax=Aeromicrobium duanguangcaii TaxID=2968086 RepID=A0ABY5KIR6_9ACTN|nr:hypothetical protein [Aeromicrobium duanguangcaii]MCD9153976.1 hypothetical protein [Aeromicrobium duanguangcaii]MCL3837711.1 hypothetical protein [Aeromicrobium duanguangcaii]UUI68946.1 hypothetical protein NP095_02230 [Aeromicrobium duanguangcaii]